MKIDIKGTIVSNDESWIYDLYGIENTSPKSVTDALAMAEDDELIEVDINSGGGDVFSGSEIYTALRSYKGDVNIRIVGLCASAASVIAMARHSEMSPTAQMMIHNVSAYSAGDYKAMKHTAEVLQTANKSVAAAYTTKTGLSEKEVLSWMDKETWFTAEEALEIGLIDEIMKSEDENEGKTKLVASIGCTILPEKLIDEYRSKKSKLQSNLDALKAKEI